MVFKDDISTTLVYNIRNLNLISFCPVFNKTCEPTKTKQEKKKEKQRGKMASIY